ncbi:hypothetical protein JCM8202_002472 [Rhodotorula sphaerocarpa]
MSDRPQAASTPPSSSRSAYGSARHLKRLSLSGSAFSPASGSGSPSGLGSGTGSPSGNAAVGTSPLIARTARPASMIGSPGMYSNADSPASRSSAPGDRTSSPSLLRRSTSYRTTPGGSPAVGSPGTSSHLASTPEDASTPTNEDQDDSGGSGRATPVGNGSVSRKRRGASISYTGSTTPSRLSLDGRPSHEGPSPRASLDAADREAAFGPARAASEGLAVATEDERSSSPSARSGHSPALSADSNAAPTSTTTSAPVPVSSSTLLEQNADLLSIIAKKERKCLDLREELKRNEADLAALKHRWQAIVARSLQAQAYQPYVPSQHRSSPSIATTASTSSPNTSPTPRPASLPHTTHSLDLSLLAGSVDSVTYNPDGTVAPRGLNGESSPIPDSVKAAGTWFGSALGRVLEAAVGMPPPHEEQRQDDSGMETPVAATFEEGVATAGLGIVQEEEDEEETAETAPRARSSAESGGARPPPRHAPTLSITTSDESPTSPVSSREATSPSGSVSRSARSPPSPSASSPSISPSHARTRSAFSGLLSDRLSSRWAALSSSEMLQSSKRATLGLVDTFEQGLAHALGPLEPPPLPQAADERRDELRRRDRPPGTPAEETARRSPAAAGATAGTGAGSQRLPMPGATPGQGLASLFAMPSSGRGRSPSTSPAL